jgi:poly(3-hydroxyoctanoate) depolymerase
MRFVFLPGASGNREFWQPVSDLLSDLGPRAIVGWPGLGGVPSQPDVGAVGDLVQRVVPALGPDVHLIAQSMGTVFQVYRSRV